MSCICHSRHLSEEGKMFFYAKIEGVLHMNPQVIEYYESLLKFEVMETQYTSTSQTLIEIVEQYVGQDAVHENDILIAYTNVMKELIG